ncbi:MAG: TM2 domain-containing membrane protein YozV [Saprospiraceae bacterium]|jgi:TM2 domain-containing membrane protein YozV
MKDKNIAAILAFFFGIFGVHRFYLGQKGLGILYLMFFWVLGIPAIIGLIDAIIFLSMGQDDFDMKYNRRLYPDHKRQDTDFTRADTRAERRDYRVEQRDLRHQRRIERRENVRPEPQPQRRQGRPHPQPETPTAANRRNNPFKMSGIEKYKEFDYDGAIEDFKKALAVQPTDVAVHFNLACTYSLSEEKENAFFHLGKAVEYGFVDFKKIQEHDALAYLRIQDEFDIFKKNGYRLNVPPPPQAPSPPIIEEAVKDSNPEPTEDLLSKNSVLLDQIKRLGELRERGLLTNEEFDAQKRKLLD